MLKMLKEQTGWCVDAKCFIMDSDQNLIFISANIDIDDPPEFKVVQKILDDEDETKVTGIQRY
jgi:hypothetical protein